MKDFLVSLEVCKKDIVKYELVNNVLFCYVALNQTDKISLF